MFGLYKNIIIYDKMLDFYEQGYGYGGHQGDRRYLRSDSYDKNQILIEIQFFTKVMKIFF